MLNQETGELRRNPEDPRLPAYSAGEWSVVGDRVYQNTSASSRSIAVAYTSCEDAAAFAASKEAIGHLFALVTDFPQLTKDGAQYYANDVCDHLEEKMPSILETLRKAGIRL